MKMPPPNLGGFTPRHRQRVRYWPLRDAPCCPHEGRVTHVDTRAIGGSEELVLWISGKSGFVRLAHVELLEDAP